MDDALILKHCTILQSEDKRARKRALENVFTFLKEKDISLADKVRLTFKNILNCFNDKAEACRELAANIVLYVVDELEFEDVHITYLMPVLLQRLGGHEIVESSEEVRLLLVIILHTVIKKCSGKILPYFDDIIQILKQTLMDPYPKIKKESCECAANLGQAIPQHFYMQSESLVKPMLHIFAHQHYKIRVTAIISLGKVVQYGNNKSAEIAFGSFGERLFDQTPAVRSAVTKVIGEWLVNLKDRYSYFHNLLPLILTSLSDEDEEIRREAWNLWDAAGKQYVMENENELKNKMDFLTEAPAHYPPNIQRPNLGCRTLVQRNLIKIVPAVSLELSDWLAEIRVKSSLLLNMLLINAEDYITQHLDKLLVGMYNASLDEDARVVQNVEKAAVLLGYFVAPEIYCKLVLPKMDESPNSGQLLIFAGILRGSDRSKLCKTLVEIGGFLSSRSICHSRNSKYQMQLLCCCEAIMEVCKEDSMEVAQNLFVIIVSVLGLATEDVVTKKATGCMESLKALEGCKSLEDVYKLHMRPVLEDLLGTAESWSLYTTDKAVFEAIIVHSGSGIGQNLDVISPVISITLMPEKDAEVKLKMLTLMSVVLANRQEAFKEAPDVGSFITTMVKEGLMPNLVWHAGRTSEAIRIAALSCLCTALQDKDTAPSPFNDPDTLQEVYESILPLLISLIEDLAKKTRLLACRALSLILKLAHRNGQLRAINISNIYPALLKRLDDVSDEVRIAAVKTTVKMFKMLPDDYNIETSISHFEATYSSMLIHMDDPDPKFQKIMLDALKEVGKIKPGLLQEKITCSMHKFRNIENYKELAKHLEQLLNGGQNKVEEISC